MKFLIGCALLFVPPLLFTCVWMFIFRRSTDSEHGGYEAIVGPIVTTANEVSRGGVRGRRVFFLSLILYWGALFWHIALGHHWKVHGWQERK